MVLTEEYLVIRCYHAPYQENGNLLSKRKTSSSITNIDLRYSRRQEDKITKFQSSGINFFTCFDGYSKHGFATWPIKDMQPVCTSFYNTQSILQRAMKTNHLSILIGFGCDACSPVARLFNYAFPATKNFWPLMNGWYVHDEFVRKRSWPNIKVISRHFAGGAEEIYEKPESG
jgi:hypothetical protein